ncbi:MAG: PAS domain S-box protein [Sandaracinaceae bacterium]|nr:PAS domain S-box protein [Sandaracinaceae bacterium]
MTPDRARAEEDFRRAMSLAPTPMLLADQTGTIIAINRHLAERFGYDPDELVGASVESLVPTRFRDGHPNLRAGFSTDPRSRPMGHGRDLTALLRDGSEIPVEIGLTPVQTSEGLLVAAAVVDVSERKRAEERLRALADDLARSNAELEQFAYVASHDLQEPLRVITNFTELIQTESQASLDEETRAWLGFVVEAAARMRHLMTDLLELSRIGRGQRRAEPVRLDDVLDEALANLQSALEASGARIERGALPSVVGVRSELVRLFQNLLANAIKFRRGPPRLAILATETEQGVVVMVSDDGIGIEERYLERIFDPFQRLHTADEYDGSGMGLAVCRKIVAQVGGEIWATSSPGAGTTFHVRFKDPPPPL